VSRYQTSTLRQPGPAVWISGRHANACEQAARVLDAICVICDEVGGEALDLIESYLGQSALFLLLEHVDEAEIRQQDQDQDTKMRTRRRGEALSQCQPCRA